MTIRQRPIGTLPSPGIDAGPCAWKATPGRSASDLGNVEGPAPTSPATPPAFRERAYPKGGDVPRAANGLKGGDRSLAQALETHRSPWKATQSADRRPSWQTLWKPGADESRHVPLPAASRGLVERHGTYRVQPTGSKGGARSDAAAPQPTRLRQAQSARPFYAAGIPDCTPACVPGIRHRLQGAPDCAPR